MAIQSHSRSHISWSVEKRQGIKYYYIIMLALFPKVPKTQRPKALKIDVFDYGTIVWRPISREPLRVRISVILPETSHWATSLPPTVRAYLHSNFRARLRKRMYFKTECIIALQGCFALFQRYCRFSAENSDSTPISPEFWGCSSWTWLPMLGLRGAKTVSYLIM